MNKIRVLFVTMPRMLCDVLKRMVEEQSDMESVGEIEDATELLSMGGQRRADVVIAGLEDPEISEICSGLLDEYPHMKVLVLSTDGGRAILYELRPHKIPIAEISPDQLLDAIRDAVRRSTA